MRQLNRIIIHCSATKPTHNVTVDEIRGWHLKRGWSDIGYHYFIDRQGKLFKGRPLERSGAHTKGHNHDSIGICMAGGVDQNNDPENNFNGSQFVTLESLVNVLAVQHDMTLDDVSGHYEYSSKACPSFDVDAWLEKIS